MTAADILDALVKVNLASGAAILVVAALRKTARSRFGARLAYGLWLLPLLAGVAVLLPARQVVVVHTAAPMTAVAVRIGPSLGAPSATAVAAGPSGSALLVGLWLAGVVGAALVMAVLQRRFIMRARQGGVGPAVVGLIAPRILIPKDFAERYSPPEQALVLAHEQAHLARQDSRLNGLVAALQCFGWFNPLVHLAARLMRIDQELACDEAVVGRFPDARRAYAEVLLKAQLAVLPLPVGCYWPSRSRHPLVERVAMLKRPRIGRARWRTGAAALGCLWAGAGMAAWASQPAEVRTVFKAAPVAAGAGEPLVSDAKVDDAVSSPVTAAPAARSMAGRHRAAAVAPAETAPAPRPIQIGLPPPVIEHVLIVNAQRIDQDKILSMLGIRPGDSVTADRLNAADKALFDSGLFSDWHIQAPPPGGSGDLRVWVKEKPAEAPAVSKSATTPHRVPALVQAKAEPPPALVPPSGTYRTVVRHVVVQGARRVDQATILSKLALPLGRTVTGEDLEAALKRLSDTGEFAAFDVRPPPRGGSGDLVLRVTENPLIDRLRIEGAAHLTDFRLRGAIQERPDAPLSGPQLNRDVDTIVELYREAGWPHAKVTPKITERPGKRVDLTLVVHEGAKGPPGDLPTGLITISAEHMNPEDGRHRTIWTGHVETLQRGRRVLSDLLVLTSRGPDEPGGPDLKEALWEGDVRVDVGNAAATADRAVYDAAANTMTLSGHVIVQRGPWVAKNDQLVIPMKDPS